MREFNIFGPVDPRIHYHVDRVAVKAALREKIDKGRYVTLNAARLGIDTAGLEITVRTTVDPRVLFALKGPEDHGSCLGTIEYDVKVSGEVSDEDMETIHKLCRYSPVHGMMAETIAIKGEVSRA